MDAHTSPTPSADATRTRNVSFIDEDGEIANVHIELRIKNGKAQFAVTNDGASGCGQHDFKPRTAAQRKLLSLWNKYHLNDMHAGTVVQEEAIDEWKKKNPAHVSHDAIVSFLKSKKLYVHHLPDGTPYTYGSAWLYRDLPVDIWEQVESVCQSIEEEEEERRGTEKITHDLTATHKDHIMRKLEEKHDDDAPRVYALALSLGLTVEEALNDCDVSEDDIEHGKRAYLVADEGTTEQIARDYVENTIDDVLDIPDNLRPYFDKEKYIDDCMMDGYGHILNSWDGTEDTETVDGTTYYIIRR